MAFRHYITSLGVISGLCLTSVFGASAAYADTTSNAAQPLPAQAGGQSFEYAYAAQQQSAQLTRPSLTASNAPAPQVVTPTATTATTATASTSKTTTTAVPAGTAQQIAASLVPDPQQFTCLVSLWNKESGWRTNAANASGAYGIPQALPGSKMASAGADWQTSALTQITWGLGYISGRYGTPCGAWAHSQSTGWY